MLYFLDCHFLLDGKLLSGGIQDLVCACAGLEFLFNARGIQEGLVLYYFTSLSREVNEPIETCGILFGD